MPVIKLKYVGPATGYYPEFGPNADWEGQDAPEAAARIATGWWANEDAGDAPAQPETIIQDEVPVTTDAQSMVGTTVAEEVLPEQPAQV